MALMILIPADSNKELLFKTFKTDDWQGMAEAIGASYIERVRVGPNESLAVDEEGLYALDKGVNIRASTLYGTQHHGSPIIGDALFGVEVMGPDGADWVTTSKAELKTRLQVLLLANDE